MIVTYLLAFRLARYAGLRIHECFRIDTAIAWQAIREHAITIKGKDGKIRTVPINQQIVSAMEKCLEVTPIGSKLLVPDGVPTYKAINQLQQFILRNRVAVQDSDSNRSLTFHGLRYTYAAEKYRQLIADGISELDAHLTVSRLLGHERADVTNIYLSSKGEFVDWHIHTEEIEYYYILSGEGIFTNSDKTEQTVTTGDVCTMERNGGHAIRQAGNETLEFIALIIYTD